MRTAGEKVPWFTNHSYYKVLKKKRERERRVGVDRGSSAILMAVKHANLIGFHPFTILLRCC